eukprot:4699858-Prorocentrum_lima.AAC.1
MLLFHAATTGFFIVGLYGPISPEQLCLDSSSRCQFCSRRREIQHRSGGESVWCHRALDQWEAVVDHTELVQSGSSDWGEVGLG